MRKLAALVHRELLAYFSSPLAYVILTAFLFINGYVFYLIVAFLNDPRTQAMAPLRLIFGGTIFFWLFLLFVVPVITMRLLAEERRSGTLEVLLTSPVSEGQVVMGKFLAAFVFYLFLWLPTWVYVDGSERGVRRARLFAFLTVISSLVGLVVFASVLWLAILIGLTLAELPAKVQTAGGKEPGAAPGPRLGNTVVDFLAAARQTLWQVLPLGPTGFGDSPYSSFCSAAGNPLLIDLEARLEDLHGRVHRGAYRAQPSRRRFIPKPDGRQRPLGIAALRPEALLQILEVTRKLAAPFELAAVLAEIGEAARSVLRAERASCVNC